MKIIRIARVYGMTLKQQEKKIRQEYENVTYFSSDGRGMITILAEGKREKGKMIATDNKENKNG